MVAHLLHAAEEIEARVVDQRIVLPPKKRTLNLG